MVIFAGRVVRRIILIIFAVGLTACEELSDRISSTALPRCDSERDVDGWMVKSALAKTPSDDLVIRTWAVERQFSTFFGAGVAFDASRSPTPYLQFRNDYKSGDFVIRLPDGTALSGHLNAQVAMTTADLRPIDFEAHAREPVQLEHTSHEGTWKVYQTTGLPEAISAAESDLALAEERLGQDACAAERA